MKYFKPLTFRQYCFSRCPKTARQYKFEFISRLVTPLTFAILVTIRLGLFATGNEPSQEENAIRALIKMKRPMPLTHIDAGRKLYVRDFGALPDDGQDDDDALQLALAEAKKSDAPTEIIFESGTYHLKPFHGETPTNLEFHCLNIEGVTNWVLTGNHTRFLIQNPQAGFIRIFQSSRVIVQGFEIDYDPLPFSQGQIEMVDLENGVAIVHIQPNFPSLNAPHLKGSHLSGNYAGRRLAMIMDPTTGAIKRGVGNADIHGGLWWTNATASIGGFQINLEKKSELTGVTPGDVLVFLIPRRPIGIVRPINSDQITVSQVTAFASPNTAFSGAGVSGYHILHCNLLKKPGRYLTSNADALTIFIYGRLGIWLEGCHFENTFDDVMQPEGFKCAVDSVLGPRQIRLKGVKLTAMPDAVLTGDTLLFFNARQAVPIWEGQVESIDQKSNTLIFSTPMPIEKIYSAGGSNGGDITLVYNKSASTSYFVVRSNTFSNSMGNTFVSHVPKCGGIIEGNLFYNGSAGITFANHQSWTYYPGYPKEVYKQILDRDDFSVALPNETRPIFTENILIKGNTFVGGQASVKSYRENMGAVSFYLYGGAWKLPAQSVGYSNLVISHNLFLNYPGKTAIRIHNAAGVIIEHNLFDLNIKDKIYRDPFDSPDRSAVQVAYVSNVFLMNNRTLDRKSQQMLAVGDGASRVRETNTQNVQTP